MKKVIIALCIAIAIAVAVLLVLQRGRRHRVADFGEFPCAFSQADEIAMEGVQGRMVLARRGSEWRIAQPVDEPLDAGAAEMLGRFLAGRMFVDMECREGTCHGALDANAPRVEVRRGGQELCRFSIGRAEELASVDAERRWLGMQGRGYRCFVPLMDFGPLLMQPMAGWRDRQALELSAQEITGVEVRTAGESYSLVRTDIATERDPQGWRVASARRNGVDVDVTGFALDAMRMRTMLELVTPLYVDDWADGMTDADSEGELVLHTVAGDRVLEIGRALDDDARWGWLGHGARLLHVRGSARYGVASLRRLAGLFPSLHDMRDRRVWRLDLAELSRIEVESGTECVRYAPASADGWKSGDCADGADTTMIDPQKLAQFARMLEHLEAIRYLDGDRDGWTQSAEIRMYRGPDVQPYYRLAIGNGPDVRECRLFGSDGREAVPPFLVPDKIALLLLARL